MRIKKILKSLLLVVVLVTNVSLISAPVAAQDDTLTWFKKGVTDTRFSSFTNFEGGLTPPSSEGFDPTLTQATDARTFVKNVANFALGFLGLVAILIIIYSGFLYVTSRGEADQAEKGKKGITYAVIGIIIILASFAIVNTVIRAPSGAVDNRGGVIAGGGSGSIFSGERGSGVTTASGGGIIIQPSQSGLRGVAPGGLALNQAGGITSLDGFNSSAEEIKDIARDFYEAYTNFSEANLYLQKLKSYDPGDWTTRNDFANYLQNVRADLLRIQNSTQNISFTAIGIRQLIDNVIDPGLSAIAKDIAVEEIDQFENLVLDNDLENWADSVGTDLRQFWNQLFGNESKQVQEYLCLLDPEDRAVNSTVLNCAEGGSVNVDKSNLGRQIDDAFDNVIDQVVLIDGLYRDYNETIENLSIRLKNIENALTSFGAGTDLTLISALASSSNNLGDLFESAKDGFDNKVKATNVAYEIREIPENFDLFSKDEGIAEAVTSVRNQLKFLQELHDALNAIQFTVPIINASSFTGNAPFIVTFDGTASYDPSNLSIENSQYHWDPDGDGDYNNSPDTKRVNCISGSVNSSNVTCIFGEPGSYVVGLKLDPNANVNLNSNFIAPGITYATVRVLPTSSKITLTATPPGYEVNSGQLEGLGVLRAYDVDEDNNRASGTILTDRNQIIVTQTEAEAGNGIQFDASGTVPTNEITNFQWFFSDGTTISGASESKIEKKFTRPGTYDATLTVTDVQGNVDRKYWKIVVTDLVARISASPQVGNLDTEFVFDAAASRSINGQIRSYLWKVSENGSTFEDVPGNSESIFKYKFETPGVKKVRLEIGDDISETTQTADIEVTVESKAPQANFFTTRFDSGRPSTVAFDATSSTDPDPGDDEKLNYRWKIFNAAEGSDYEIVEGKLSGNKEEASKLLIKFKKKRIYTIELTVLDDYPPEIRKSSTIREDVKIDSLIDIQFGEDQLYATQLARDPETGELGTDVTFEIISEFGEIVSIDYGNGNKDEKRVTGGKAIFNYNYKKSGSYTVSAQARKGNDKNTIQNVFIVGGGNKPIAVPKLIIGQNTYTTGSNIPEVYRSASLTFDASGSLNTTGTTNNLDYSWNFGDGDIVDGRAVLNHTYDDLPPGEDGEFEITLTVVNEFNRSQVDSAKIKVKVVNAKPKAQSLNITSPDDLETPFRVNIEVINPSDSDGRIVQYRYYYYPLDDPDRQLGVQIGSEPKASIEVDTFGDQGEEVEYGFCVDMTDNEGNKSECLDLFNESSLPTITATNGPNDPPIALFRVERTSVNVGETVNFYDQSEDPDGEIIEWVLDFEGDGSFVNDKKFEQPNLSYVYEEAGEYDVRLRVLDDKGATSISAPIRIFVDSKLDDPVAAFTYVTQDLTVEFDDNSTADTANGGRISEWEWDFDLKKDSNGDGDPTNDVDSTRSNPSHNFNNSGTYQVKLTVTDNEFNENNVIRNVIVQEIPSGAYNPFETPIAPPTGTQTDNGQLTGTSSVDGSTNVTSVLKTIPAFDDTTDTLYLTGNEQNVTFDFSAIQGDVAKIIIDKNIYFDTNSGTPGSPGDGIRNNDLDYASTNRNSWTTDYNASWQPIRVQLTVIGRDGSISTDQADIVFRNSGLQAFLGLEDDNGLAAILYFVLGFSVLLYGGQKLKDRKGTNQNRKLI